MPLSVTELEPLLRLGLVRGIGPQRLAVLMERFGGAGAVIAADEARLRAVSGVGRELARRIRSAGGVVARAETARALRRLQRVGAVALTCEDPLYPASFLDLSDRPYLLFAIGDPSLLERPAIAVVGTRSPTRYGRSAAEDLSRDLALSGFLIVSGMARGIDTAAHRGALAAGGGTVGILGHGIEQIYPPEGRRLFEEVGRRGLLLTEYPPGETPKAGNFPRRNRLITAISRAVVVVEMGLRSGAQHTVNFALEQGREVMAVPGPIGSPSSEG
ncbi:MAG TPA: DNA-processing protein DprA, partial [Longimicrobiaceae bacterium]|nr:DNA-processing protein DprA [Longimicrobiaceae bacterium]